MLKTCEALLAVQVVVAEGVDEGEQDKACVDQSGTPCYNSCNVALSSGNCYTCHTPLIVLILVAPETSVN